MHRSRTWPRRSRKKTTRPGTTLLGQDVTVSGEITEVVADGAFWIGGGGDIFGEGAPVVSASGNFTDMGLEDPEGLIDSDTIVHASGTVQAGASWSSTSSRQPWRQATRSR